MTINLTGSKRTLIQWGGRVRSFSSAISLSSLSCPLFNPDRQNRCPLPLSLGTPRKCWSSALDLMSDSFCKVMSTLLKSMAIRMSRLLLLVLYVGIGGKACEWVIRKALRFIRLIKTGFTGTIKRTDGTQKRAELERSTHPPVSSRPSSPGFAIPRQQVGARPRRVYLGIFSIL